MNVAGRSPTIRVTDIAVNIWKTRVKSIHVKWNEALKSPFSTMEWDVLQLLQQFIFLSKHRKLEAQKSPWTLYVVRSFISRYFSLPNLKRTPFHWRCSLVQWIACLSNKLWLFECPFSYHEDLIEAYLSPCFCMSFSYVCYSRVQFGHKIPDECATFHDECATF